MTTALRSGKTAAITAVILTSLLASSLFGQTSPRLPLRFEPAVGPADSAARYVARADGYELLVTSNSVELNLSSRAGDREPKAARLALEFATPDAARDVFASDPQAGVSHYMRGRDPSKWRTDVPGFGRVTCREVAPGVDLVLYGNACGSGRQLEFDFIVAAGISTESVELAVRGARSLRLQDDGDLAIDTEVGTLVQHAPVVYQVVDGARQQIDGRYVLRDEKTIGFAIGAHRSDLPLVIDPVLAWSSYFGGTGYDQVSDVVVDASGFVYVTGTTSSTDFPILNGWDPTIQPFYDVFVSKLDPTLSLLVWSTYIGGTGDYTQPEVGTSLGVDAAGNVFVTGVTTASDFPVLNAFQSTFGGVQDAFLFELAPAGNALVYSTYLGGSQAEDGEPPGSLSFSGRLVVDANGNSFVTGGTLSANFPTVNAWQNVRRGAQDAFVASFDASGAPRFSTYLGGPGYDEGTSIAFDSAGNVVLGGIAEAGFPTTPGAYSTSGYGYIAKMDANGSQLLASTMFRAAPNAVALDAADRIYICGATSDYALPTTFGAWQTEHGGSYDGHHSQAFVTAFHADLGSLVYSTYYGFFWDNEYANDLVVGATGEVTIAGTVSNHTGTPYSEAFLTAFSHDGSALAYEYRTNAPSTYGSAIAYGNGLVWFAGLTWSTSLPISPGTFQMRNKGLGEGYISSLDPTATTLANLTLASTKVIGGFTLTGTVTLAGNAPAGGTFVSLVSSDPSAATVPSSVYVPGGQCSESFTIQSMPISAPVQVTIDATSGTTFSRSFQVWLGPTYTIEFLGTLSGAESRANGINALGRMTGSSRGSDIYYHAVRFLDGGGVEDLGDAEGMDINLSGQVAATFGTAMRYTDGVGMVDLGTLPNGFESAAYALNDAGQVVGWSDGKKIQQHAIRYTDGVGMKDLGTLGGQLSCAFDINNSGQVVGESYLAGNTQWRAFRYTDGVGMENLGVPTGFDHSYGMAINDLGQVAGTAYVSGYSVGHAFRYTDGIGIEDLGTLPGETSSFAHAMNSSGEVAGISGTRVFKYTDGIGMQDIHDMVAPEQLFGWTLFDFNELDMNDAGVIAGGATFRGNLLQMSAYRLQPSSANWFNYGTGWSGTYGVPSFAASNPPHIGQPITLGISNSLGATTGGLFVLGFSQASIPTRGGTLLVLPALILPLAVPANGLTLSGTIPDDPALVGLNLYLQVIEFDAGAIGGLSFTPGMQMVFGG